MVTPSRTRREGTKRAKECGYRHGDKDQGPYLQVRAELKGRVAALDLEYEGELMPEEARPLLHLSGVPWARIGEHVGQRSLRVTADTYSHVLVDERELDYAAMFT